MNNALGAANEALLYTMQILLLCHPRPQVEGDPNIANSCTNTFTFSDFKVALCNPEENELCCSKDNGGNTGGVMATTNGTHKPNKFVGKCFKCGRKGHKSVDCFSNKVVDKWCQRCRNNSHNTKDCRKGNYDSAGVALQRKEQKLNNDSINHSFIFTIKDEESRGEITPNLLLDTGATSHIINDKSKFVYCDTKFDPSTHFIELADGSRANVVLGKGNAKVKLFDVNGILQDVLCNENFSQSHADRCIYIRNSDTEGCVFLIVWVDNIIISTTSSKLLESVKESLCQKFKMKDRGELSWFLGTQFKCNGTTIEMSQSQYIDKILYKCEMSDCMSISTPCAVEVDKECDFNSRELGDPRLYRGIVGSLIYVMTCTRPDLCYIVTKLSQNMAKPTEADLNRAKYALRYFKGT